MILKQFFKNKNINRPTWKGSKLIDMNFFFVFFLILAYLEGTKAERLSLILCVIYAYAKRCTMHEIVSRKYGLSPEGGNFCPSVLQLEWQGAVDRRDAARTAPRDTPVIDQTVALTSALGQA